MWDVRATIVQLSFGRWGLYNRNLLYKEKEQNEEEIVIIYEQLISQDIRRWRWFEILPVFIYMFDTVIDKMDKEN